MIASDRDFISMSQRSFHDHAYLELLKSSRTGESTLACRILDARHQEMRSGGGAALSESQQLLSDSVDHCVHLLSELYFKNTQTQPSTALLALWRKQTLEILFRPQRL
jgi:hypothetical protein